MRTLSCAIFFLLLFGASAQAARMAITVRAADGAALVSGEEARVEILRENLAELQQKKWRLDELGKYLDEKYGGTLKIELFRKLKLEESGVFESLRMPLRRAALLAVLPPVEGLALEDARAVAEAFHIRFASREDYDRLSDEEKIREAFIAETQLAVFSGTGPASEVEIVMVKKE